MRRMKRGLRRKRGEEEEEDSPMPIEEGGDGGVAITLNFNSQSHITLIFRPSRLITRCLGEYF